MPRFNYLFALITTLFNAFAFCATEYGIYAISENGHDTAVSLVAAGAAEEGSIRRLNIDDDKELFQQTLSILKQSVIKHGAFIPIKYILDANTGFKQESATICNGLKIRTTRPYFNQTLAAYRDREGKGHVCSDNYAKLSSVSKAAVTLELMLSVANADDTYLSDFVGTVMSTNLGIKSLEGDELGDYRDLSSNLWLKNKDVQDKILIATNMGSIAKDFELEGQNPADHKKKLCFAKGLYLERRIVRRFAVWIETADIPCQAGSEINQKTVGLLLIDSDKSGEVAGVHLLELPVGFIVAKYDPDSNTLQKLCTEDIGYDKKRLQVGESKKFSACAIHIRSNGIKLIISPILSIEIMSAAQRQKYGSLEAFYETKTRHAKSAHRSIAWNTLASGEYQPPVKAPAEYIGDAILMSSDQRWWVQPILHVDDKYSVDFFTPFLCNTSGYCYNGLAESSFHGFVIDSATTYRRFSSKEPLDFMPYTLKFGRDCQCRSSRKMFRAQLGYTCKDYEGDVASCR